MKIKTSELTGAALDWAVAEAEGLKIAVWYVKTIAVLSHGVPRFVPFAPSRDWSQGGPIVEREGIYLRAIRKEGHKLNGTWLAQPSDTNTGSMVQWVRRNYWPNHYWSGPTPLIAAMRCYVASKLGDEVEIPDELSN